MKPQWRKMTLPNNDSSKVEVEEIRKTFRKIVMDPIYTNPDNEPARLCRNKDENENYILYFSPTTNPQIFELIKKHIGIACEKPNPYSIEVLETEPPFFIKRF